MPKQTALGVETLQRDAAALFSFVDSIFLHCYQDSESAAYLEPSLRFFRFIRDLADATKAYLNAFPANPPRDQRLYQDYRQKLETIRSGWFEFHLLIKSAVDADTLNVPYTLVEALTRRLNSIRRFEKTKFAIFHFDELNYLEIPVSEIKKTTDRLKRIIPDRPSFPADLGLIGIPYSQSSSLYLNTLISHEIGHFVFQESNLKDSLLPEIGKTLEQALGPQLLLQISSVNLEWSKDRLASWAEELFCDLFATWLVGPCYSLMFVELFGLTTILDPANPNGYTATAGSTIFSRSHPADLFRIKEQVLLLQKLLWWNEVDAIQSHYVDVLRSSISVHEKKFTFQTTEQGYADETLKALFNLAPHVRSLAADVMKDSTGSPLDCGVADYSRFGGLVGEYLGKAVSPSTVFDGKNHWYPNTITLLNASMKFYLQSLEELMKGIKDQKTTLAGHRSRWIKRVESLTSKAIEDCHLLVAEKGALQVGSSFQRADLNSPESTDH